MLLDGGREEEWREREEKGGMGDEGERGGTTKKVHTTHIRVRQAPQTGSQSLTDGLMD